MLVERITSYKYTLGNEEIDDIINKFVGDYQVAEADVGVDITVVTFLDVEDSCVHAVFVTDRSLDMNTLVASVAFRNRLNNE